MYSISHLEVLLKKHIVLRVVSVTTASDHFGTSRKAENVIFNQISGIDLALRAL